jgi:undecaprenyl phosphate-alpha-L-ara4N flippase subunit ArnE
VLQKRAASRHLAGTRRAADWARALVTRELLGAAACLAGGTVLWLAVLYRMDVSRAFPILSLGSVVVLLVSRFYLGEAVSVRRWAGAVLIAIGVALVSST